MYPPEMTNMVMSDTVLAARIELAHPTRAQRSAGSVAERLILKIT